MKRVEGHRQFEGPSGSHPRRRDVYKSRVSRFHEFHGQKGGHSRPGMIALSKPGIVRRNEILYAGHPANRAGVFLFKVRADSHPRCRSVGSRVVDATHRTALNVRPSAGRLEVSRATARRAPRTASGREVSRIARVARIARVRGTRSSGSLGPPVSGNAPHFD